MKIKMKIRVDSQEFKYEKFKRKYKFNLKCKKVNCLIFIPSFDADLL